MGYRRFAQKQAEQLDIKGWTRNLADGRVEIFASASEPAIEKFCDRLRQGPLLSRVENVLVEKTENKSDREMHSFEIAPDAGLHR